MSTLPEYRRCQDIQQRAWALTEEGYLMPISLLVSAQKHGGLVLGAFDGDEMVGFAFAFLGMLEGELGLYSQITAVLPEYQNRGIGVMLKHAQCEEALRRGLPAIAWAFDPLQAGNAHFNLHKLGARCRRYEVDMYGPRNDLLNFGLATDRLIAEWPVRADERAEQREIGGRAADHRRPPADRREPEDKQIQGGVARVLKGVTDGSYLRPELGAGLLGHRLELEIPADVVALKQQRPELAALWQQRVREAFQAAFDRGYVAVDFLRSPDGQRCWYVLERSADLP